MKLGRQVCVIGAGMATLHEPGVLELMTHERLGRGTNRQAGRLPSKGHPLGATALAQPRRGLAARRPVKGARVGQPHRLGRGAAFVMARVHRS
jgi:hypothetical protein